MVDGRSLVAAYIKALRTVRGVEQEDVANRLGVHKNTIFRIELVSGKDASSKLETAIAATRALGGGIAHVVALRAEQLPADYPAAERGHTGEPTPEAAADIAIWYVAQQDAELAAQARRSGAVLTGTRDLLSSIQWEAFQNPGKVLSVYL